VLSVGFDEKETLADLKTFHQKIGKELKNKYPKSYAQWHFTLGKADQIQALTKATGFKYIWDQIDQTYYHPNVYVVITPKGKISRYLFGLYPVANDIEMALREAANEKISYYSWINSALQSCLKYDHLSGQYRIDISKVAGAIGFTVFILTGIIILVYKKLQK
jgi:protein SCO1/2